MGQPSLHSVFVYYRVSEEHAAAAQAAATQCLRAAMADYPGLQARLWRRPAARHGQVTVMEVFEVPKAIDERWATATEQRALSALAPWLIGERHVEVFVPL